MSRIVTAAATAAIALSSVILAVPAAEAHRQHRQHRKHHRHWRHRAGLVAYSYEPSRFRAPLPAWPHGPGCPVYRTVTRTNALALREVCH